jgi:hypothetical protein
MKIRAFIALLLFANVGFGSLENLTVTGLMRSSGVKYACLQDSSDPMSKSQWCKENELLGDFKVLSIALDQNKVLVSDAAGSRRIIPFVPDSRIASLADGKSSNESKHKLISISSLNWDWIKSSNNNMRTKVVELPIDVALRWDIMSEDEKIDIKNYYLARGIEVNVTTESNGNIHVEHHRLRDPNLPLPDKASLKSAQPPLKK